MILEHLDPLMLSRIQFAFTIAFHILFPAFTIGLASFLFVLEAIYMKTGNEVYKNVYKFWSKIFAVSFGMGVVSGIVMSYQFGTNWSVFSDKVGSVIGPIIAFEVMTAFFLEASFLGIMLFGWNKVTPKMHFFATGCVAFGTLLSAFWILSANSWMHTPQGFVVTANGTYAPTNWIEVIFNPSFPYRFLHTITASYLTTAFVVGGVSAWYLHKNIFVKEARIMFAMAMFMAIFIAPLQPIFGDLHGLNTLKHQPVKVSAMEGIWETERGAALRVFGIPNPKTETTDFEIKIPYLTSLILTHDINGEVKGLKEWKASERPPVPIVFYAFRIMVGIGLLMVLTGLIAVYLSFKKRLFNTMWFKKWCIALTPAGFIAVLTGWIVTESGRQPYIVYNYLRTADAVSNIHGASVAISLTIFIIVYSIVFGAGVYYIVKLVKAGPKTMTSNEVYGTHGLKELVTFADALQIKKKAKKSEK